MKSAIYSSVIDATPPKDPSSLLAADCSSGNCSFPTYASLGVCSECTNITPKLAGVNDFAAVASGNYTAHFLTKDAGPEFRGIRLLNGTSGLVVYQTFINITAAINPFNGATNWVRGVSINLVNTTMIITKNGNFSVCAFQCTLQLCARTYDAAIQDGKLQETASSVVSTG